MLNAKDRHHEACTALFRPAGTSPFARRDNRNGRDRLVPDASPDTDPDHPLYGRVVVFTGTLKSRTRQQAWDDVSRVGGTTDKDVTGRTNILVIGDLNPAVLAAGATTTGKAARAFALQGKGQDIEVMTEDDLIRTL
jgi:DNA polymerase-3 subunit epsilon